MKRGFDSVDNHSYIRDKLGADTIILVNKNRSSDEMKSQIEKIFEELSTIAGCKRVYRQLKGNDLLGNRPSVYRLMKELKLLTLTRKKASGINAM